MQARRRGSALLWLIPPEILLHVFELYVLVTRSSPYSSERPWPLKLKNDELAALPLTHVCRHWRSIAVDHGPLWTTIPFDLVRSFWHDELLARSKTFAITVKITDPHARHRAKAPPCILQQARESGVLLAHIHHVKSLSLAGPYEDVASVAESITRGAPCLKNLQVNVKSYIDGGQSEDGHIPLSGEFARGTPQLRGIALKFCWIPWESPIFTGLTSLSILLRTNPFREAPLDSLLQCIERLPSLKELSLVECIPYGRDLGIHEPILLPSLVALTVGGEARICAALLHYLDLPACLHLSWTSPHDCEFIPFLPVIVSHCLRASEAGKPAHTLEVADDCDALFRIESWDSTPFSPGNSPDGLPRPQLRIELEWDHDLVHGIVAEFPRV
ncbi:hypothetical protein OF83DRAFT_1180589 [Amylostereum chailletii]|nr:hypothetical protein OF83DRAFT_1180589 [Amylostereum chailletii]